VIEYIEMFYTASGCTRMWGMSVPVTSRGGRGGFTQCPFYLTITHRSDLELSGAPDAQMRAIGFSKYQWVSTERASKDNLPQNRA